MPEASGRHQTVLPIDELTLRAFHDALISDHFQAFCNNYCKLLQTSTFDELKLVSSSSVITENGSCDLFTACSNL